MNKNGQVTIFIIVAIVIVLAAIGVYFIYPDITGESVSTNPVEYIQTCLEDDIVDNVEQISLNGGSLEPEFYSEYYLDFKKYTLEYLCYTNEYLKQCVMQQPMLKSHIQEEIKDSISGKVDKCFDDLEKAYTKKGFEVELDKNGYEVELASGKIRTTIDYDLTLTKGGTDKYGDFIVDVESNLYRTVLIANNILSWEAQYGDADTSSHMNANYWLKAEKRKLTDGTRIYILTDKESEDKFMFAARSVVWPPGYVI